MAIKIILSYARSGGTLLAKCLDALPDTVVLSEVHPTFHTNGTVKEQVKKRYQIELLSEGFEANIVELNEFCKNRNWHLIIRDWTFIDFTPHEINQFKPTYKFTAYKLLKDKFDVEVISFVRNAIDIWISRWYPPRFFEIYEKYVNKLINKKIEVFKYENFCGDHKAQLNEICRHLGLTFDLNYLQFYKIGNMPGDDGGNDRSRGLSKDTIEVFPRRNINKSKIQFLSQNQQLKNCNELLDYNTDYYSEPLESGKSWFLETENWVKKISGRQIKDEF